MDVHVHNKMVDRFREACLGMVYIKVYKNNSRIIPYAYNDRTVYNVVDVDSIRKRIHTMKENASVAYNSVLSVYYKEYNMSKDAEQYHSAFDSGNVFRIVRGADEAVYIDTYKDSNSIGYSGWYHFTVTNSKKDKRTVYRLIDTRVDQMYVYFKSKKSKQKGWQAMDCRIIEVDVCTVRVIRRYLMSTFERCASLKGWSSSSTSARMEMILFLLRLGFLTPMMIYVWILTNGWFR